MIEKIPDINDARWTWLNRRNPELMQECQWRIKRLLEMAEPEFVNLYWTEYFLINNQEVSMLSKYFEGIGYKFEIKHNSFVEETSEIEIRIGL